MIIRFLITLTLLSLIGCTNSTNDDPGTTACDALGLETRSGINKVAQGTQCSRSGSPVVALTVLPEDGNVSICSGTMLNSTQVLTAAHCFDFEYTSASVQVAGVDFSVRRVRLHPEFNSDQIPFQNDVAVVDLDTPATVPALPIILSRPLEPGNIVSIFGYGNDENDDSGILRSGEMRVTGINSQFFSANFELEGSNVCQGDSGGPAIFSYENEEGTRITGVIGITSFGQVPCNMEGTSGFQFIQSNAVVDFLSNTVQGLAVQ